jgi:hypothetical protein
VILEHWHEFYGLVGTAAAALLALLFVAVSIGAGTLPQDRSGPTRTYTSPVAFHYTAVMYVSALALAPTETPTSLSVLLGGSAMIGIVYAAFIIRRLLTDRVADLPDRLAYGLAPLGSYSAMLAAAALFHVGSPSAADVLATGVLVLLIVNVRNAWDLLLVMARRRNPSP